MIFSGLYTALITPFKEDTLDEEALRFLIQRQQRAKVDGIVVLGSAGEEPTLSDKEKARVIEIAREEITGGSLIVGTGCYCTRKTVEKTKDAKKMGAEAALIVTPYYNKPTQEGLIRHYMHIADTCDLPIIIYNNPGRTGVLLTPETLATLAGHPKIIGVKESTGKIESCFQIKQLVPKFYVLSGDDAFTLPMMSLGAEGVISVVSNLVPEKMKALTTFCLDGDFVAARGVHYRLAPFFEAAFFETNPIPIKAAMAMAGLPCGDPRIPLSPLSNQYKTKLKEALEKAL